MTRGDVYWVDFEPARGGEIRKRCPAVVVSNEDANRVLNRVQVVPLTRNIRRVYSSETLIDLEGRVSKAMAHQIRTIAKERIGDYVGSLTSRELRAVEAAIRYQLDMD